MTVVAAIVLAAGAGSRFGSPKQQRLLPHVLRRIARTSSRTSWSSWAPTPPAVEGARVVTCDDWQRGPGASLRAGLAALSPETEAAVVCLADGPLLSPDAVERVIAAWRAGAGAVVAASYGGARGHPVCLGREAWADVPDDGGRALRPVLVPCDDLGAPDDVDTADDLRRVERLLGDD